MYQYIRIKADTNAATLFQNDETRYFGILLEGDKRPYFNGIIQKTSIQITDEFMFCDLKIELPYSYYYIPLSRMKDGISIVLSANWNRNALANAIVENRWFVPANRSSWKNLPIDEVNKFSCNYDKSFSKKEFQRIQLGETPLAMEDHWFAFFETNTLYWFRSWTGFGVFEVNIEEDSDGYKTAKVVASNKPEVYSAYANVELLSSLMNGLCREANEIFDV